MFFPTFTDKSSHQKKVCQVSCGSCFSTSNCCSRPQIWAFSASRRALRGRALGSFSGITWWQNAQASPRLQPNAEAKNKHLEKSVLIKATSKMRKPSKTIEILMLTFFKPNHDNHLPFRLKIWLNRFNFFWLCGWLQGNREYSVMKLKVTGSLDPSELLDPSSISLLEKGETTLYGWSALRTKTALVMTLMIRHHKSMRQRQ